MENQRDTGRGFDLLSSLDRKMLVLLARNYILAHATVGFMELRAS
jgi:hypothetical protein